MLSWPNQAKTQRALASLELLVVVDPQVSATARLAHYVIGPRFGFETPAITFGNEGITTYGLSIGYQEPYAQYQPQLIEPPPGSEVLEDWRFFYELGRAMGMQLAYRGPPLRHADTRRRPTRCSSNSCARSRVPLAEIKRYPHGHVFPDPQPFAAPKDEGWPHRLQLGHPAMLSELSAIARELAAPARRAAPGAGLGAKTPAPASTPVALTTAVALELLLVSRREHAVYNSVGQQLPALRRRRPFNPAYLHPDDAARVGLADGDTILIESAVGAVRAVLQFAADVRRGVVSMAHGFDQRAGDGRGASTSALVDDAHGFDPISGLPRMSAIPVKVSKAAQAAAVADAASPRCTGGSAGGPGTAAGRLGLRATRRVPDLNRTDRRCVPLVATACRGGA